MNNRTYARASTIIKSKGQLVVAQAGLLVKRGTYMKNYNAKPVYLLDERPLVIIPSVAKAVGLNESIILQQVHYWIVKAEERDDKIKYHDGKWWVYNTYDGWQENFPFWSISTIRRIIASLEKSGLLLSRKMKSSQWNHTKWYTINYEKIEDMNRTICSKWTDRTAQDEQILINKEYNKEYINNDIVSEQIGPLSRNSTGESTPVTSTELISTKEVNLTTLSSKADDKKNKDQKPKTPTDQQKMVGVLSRVTGLDYKINANCSRLGKDAKELLEAEYSPDVVDKLYSKGGWWYRNDWRGKKGQSPKLHDIKETIGIACKSTAVKKHNGEFNSERNFSAAADYVKWEVIEERLWDEAIDEQGMQSDGTVVTATFNQKGEKIYTRERKDEKLRK